LKKQQEKQAKKSGNTFEEVARKWLTGNIRWTEHHAAKIPRSLELHVFPLIGKILVTDLKTADLLIPLRVAERKGNLETAARIQQRTTAIMRYAVQESLIASNPASDLTGAIALPLEKMPELLERLESYSGRLLTRLAVQLNLLIFIRSSELRFARWTEIDLDGAMWTIPAEREPIPGVRYSERCAKMKTPHLVPLSKQAVTVLKQLKLLSGNSELLFPGDHDPKKPMSENTINKALRVMGYDTKVDVCGHGFRTMACSALIESGRWSKDAVERQMSHQERNNVRAAYIHKAEHLDERTQMMQWWSDWLDACRQKFVAPYRYDRQVQVASATLISHAGKQISADLLFYLRQCRNPINCASSGPLSLLALSGLALLPLAHLYPFGLFMIAPEQEIIPLPAAHKPAPHTVHVRRRGPNPSRSAPVLPGH